MNDIKYKYNGFPDKPNQGEKVFKTSLNVRLNEVFKDMKPLDSIPRISEVCVNFGLKDQDNDGETLKNNKLIDNFSVQDPFFKLDDIIVPKSTKDQILEVIDAINFRDLIYKEWGFENIEPFNKVALNFFGPPGTGKTMCAHGIASHLGKKILAIDYAQIESKFVGDAPKNLSAVFEKAKQSDALLFFDEADSVLGKRIAGISTGSEQAINSLRSQMLISLDHYSGVVIFASNFVENYDKAFETRIRHVKFNLPDANAILSMLKNMIPKRAPVGEIDFEHISKKCEGLSGRDLKNILLLSATKSAKKKKLGKDFKIGNEEIESSISTIRYSLDSFTNKDTILSGVNIKEKIQTKIASNR